MELAREDPVVGQAVATMPAPTECRSGSGLELIEEQISRLFVLVADSLRVATAAFVSGDASASDEIGCTEFTIDELHRRVEALVARELALLSTDFDGDALARLVLALRIAPELERSGDLVVHISARSCAPIVSQLTPAALDLVRRMGDVAVELWRRAGRAFQGADDAGSTDLRLLDDHLDDLHVQLVGALAAIDLSVPVAIEMGLVARFYERLGDHAVNISRRVYESRARTP